MSAGGRTGCYEWDVFGAPVALKDKKQDKKGRGKMEIGLIFKIAAVGILVTILSQVLKHSGREEHAFLISLAGLILVLSWIVPYIYDLFDTVQTLFSF
jgi:stage III sporulation protein AC